jgi:hypothetical protein
MPQVGVFEMTMVVRQVLYRMPASPGTIMSGWDFKTNTNVGPPCIK